jgi:hypothetical protein
MPKPFTAPAPAQARPPGWPTLLARAWRSCTKHPGLQAALHAERSEAIKQTRQENDQRRIDTKNAHHASPSAVNAGVKCWLEELIGW